MHSKDAPFWITEPPTPLLLGGLVSSEQKLFCVNVCKNMQNQGMMIKEKTLSRLCKVSFQQQLCMLVKTYLVAGDNDLLTYINGNKSGKNNVPLMHYAPIW